jgi:uncharacterized protein (TIGR00369 family)
VATADEMNGNRMPRSRERSPIEQRPQTTDLEQRTTQQEQGTAAHRLVHKVQHFGAPCATLIGFDIVEIADGHAAGHLQTGPQHANPMGTVHGGILCDLADAAMGMAFASTLKDDETFTTLELKINFVRPVWESLLRAEAHVTNRGKTVGLVECAIRDEHHRLVAKAVSTCLILRGKQAAGR